MACAILIRRLQSLWPIVSYGWLRLCKAIRIRHNFFRCNILQVQREACLEKNWDAMALCEGDSHGQESLSLINWSTQQQGTAAFSTSQAKKLTFKLQRICKHFTML